MWNRRNDRQRTARRLRIEPLESRDLLAVTLTPIDDQTLLSGAPLHLAISSLSDTGNPLSIAVEVSNAALTGSGTPELTAVVPVGNPSLRMAVSSPANGIDGEMVFQLFQDLTPQTVDQIVALANSGFYNGLTFHRVVRDFMIQGGDPNGNGSGGPGFRFDDEFHASLQFTSAGILAMANSGDDTNGSQFFVTAAPTRGLDFNHTIFGFLTAGDGIRQQIALVPVGGALPLDAVTMTSVSIFFDDQNGVLRLSAPYGTTGTADVTVTVTDTVTGEWDSVTFQVIVGVDTSNSPPFLGPVAPIETTVNTPVTFMIPATDVEGDFIYFAGIVEPSNANLTLTVNSATGEATLTPSGGVAGVFSVLVLVSTWPVSACDTQLVPVYIAPPTPTGIQLGSAFDTGISHSDGLTYFNNSPGRTLQFMVQGLITGAEVELFADGVLIGQTIALGSSAIIVTDGLTTLADGEHQITVRQSLRNLEVDVGNLDTVVDLESELSAPLTIHIDATPPVFTSTPVTVAREGGEYAYQVTTEPAAGIELELVQGPVGMHIDTTTGLISWTALSPQGTIETVYVHATDVAGNVALHDFEILVLPPNTAPVLVPAGPSLGTTDEDSPLAFSLATFINAGEGTTTITDEDSDAVIGGIAIVGLTGNGTWDYSLDGTTFLPVGAVWEDSALLLAHNAWLRYSPDGANAETATITYHAWDATSGTNGQRRDATVYGGITPFSEAVDSAHLAVTDLNDAPVLTPASPLIDAIEGDVAVTIALTETFINNGYGTTIIADVDTDALVGGIALIGVSGNGTWEYSIDGTTFLPVGEASSTSALLLAPTALLRYTPYSADSEAATITYRAWDATNGLNGEYADTTFNGGETAFSAAFDTAWLSVNLAPVLAPAYPSLGVTNENTPTTIALSGTFINNGTGTTIITDPNPNAQVGGIAIVGLSGNGTWEYSLDETVFLPVGPVSHASALLLAHDASLRYTPDGVGGETATIAYCAWDATSGTSGGRADATESGGAYAFSTDSDTASLTVLSVNDAPVLTPAMPLIGAFQADAAVTIALTETFINNGYGTTIIADVDTDAVVGGIAIFGVSGNGVWEYSIDGTTFSPVGQVSSTSALLLARTALLRYTPAGNLSEAATINYRAWDATSGLNGEFADTTFNGGETAFSTAFDTAWLSVNLAPLLTPAYPSLGVTNENTPTTFALSGTFINNGAGTTIITDPNPNAQVGGIAIVGLTGTGTWEYSLDGTVFLPVGPVSHASALLLAHDASLRYTPAGAGGETATIVYCAWDATTGTSGGRDDATDNGGAYAFSTATDTASLTVMAANNAPVLTAAMPSLGTTDAAAVKTILLSGSFINNGAGTTIIADADSDAVVGGIALIGVGGNGTWDYSLDGATFVSVGSVSATSALLLPFTARLRYTPDGLNSEVATIAYSAWDMTSGVAGQRADTSFNGGTTAFSVASDLASLTVTVAATASISGFVYVDVDNDGRRITPSGQPHAAIAGVTVQLYVVAGGNTSLVASTATSANGSYAFTGLAAGTYLVKQVQPSKYLDGKETVGTVGGAVRGTAGQDQFTVQLNAGENGTEYNFGERGLQPGLISLRMLRASTPAVTLSAWPTTAVSAQAASATSLATTAPVAEVVGRYLFYNNSAYDGFDPAANGYDDNALAFDKTALLPGQASSSIHTTNYEMGLNGIMIDIAALASMSLTTADFQFRTGNDNDLAVWSQAPDPVSITVREGAGLDGSDRVTIIWADDAAAADGESAAVKHAWLEVTVRDTPTTGLAKPDVFYFGHTSFEEELAALDLVLQQAGDWLAW